MPNIIHREDAGKVAKRILASNRYILIDNIKIIAKTSLGISIYPDNGNTIPELINNADKAMYISKKNKDNKKYTFYK